jgi:hypothetical protein
MAQRAQTLAPSAQMAPRQVHITLLAGTVWL